MDLSRCEKYLSDILQRPLSVCSEIVYNGPEIQNFVPLCHGKSGYFSVRIILITVKIFVLNLHSCNAFIFQFFFSLKFVPFYVYVSDLKPHPKLAGMGGVSWNTAEQ